MSGTHYFFPQKGFRSDAIGLAGGGVFVGTLLLSANIRPVRRRRIRNNGFHSETGKVEQ
jgi:hypothetical protein